jgi:hypothetical protein
VHPAADLFPLMSEAELRELGEDIKANGLRASIVLYKGKLLDGRNRLDAMELVGVKFGFMHGTDSATKNKLFYLHACDGPDIFNSEAAVIDHFGGMSDVDPGADPYAFVLSANLHRRHLTSEQKRELIAKVLKAKPEASNRTVAKQVRAHHTTVGTVRAEMESTGEISQLDKTTGADGKKRKKPAKKRAVETDQERATGSGEISATENPTIVDGQILPPEPKDGNPIWNAWCKAKPKHRREFVTLGWDDIERERKRAVKDREGQS